MNIICGMHRSGTSLITRLLHEAGADLGDPATLYSGDRWNPEGYFEQRDIQAINIRLVNGPWGKLAYLRLPSEDRIRARANRAHTRIRQAADVYRGKTVKENRFCLTLRAWRDLGAEVSRVLLCIRHPAAVARSLWRRNRAPRRFAYHLWYIHLQRLLQQTQDIPTWITVYERWLSAETFGAEFAAVLRFLNMSVPTDISSFSTTVRSDANGNDDDFSKIPAASSALQELWSHLLLLHENQFAPSLGEPRVQ